MLNNTNCPVPKDQRPIEEFTEISNSWFFSLPLKNTSYFLRVILISWLVGSFIFIFIGTGSVYLIRNKIELITISIVYSLIIPMLIIIRLIIGWSYIHKRLVTQIVDYEETDWHDGQRWKKPYESHLKDVFIAKYEVKPIIKLLKNSFKLLIFILCLGSTYLIHSFK